MAGAGIAAASGPSAPSMAVSGAAAGPSTHPIPTQSMRYQVFLSFRGPDSRKTFTDHLYAALDRKGLVTFRDDREIEKGEFVPKKLRKAIRQSWYFVIVLSKNFASSRWCLDELQQIVETKPEQTVFPVFYDVEPGDIGQALAVLENTASGEITGRWKEALSRVSKFGGWPTKDK
ncbi:TMV resistance protein N-like [Neltuma alba]|uniref:TMV resistance protein N-like n=1 Tax=Neltuma alba TaxID=207710 RepID=UPI0010A440DE|nr:TMV resistance protein N-like [Prosopis alba]